MARIAVWWHKHIGESPLFAWDMLMLMKETERTEFRRGKT